MSAKCHACGKESDVKRIRNVTCPKCGTWQSLERIQKARKQEART